MPFGCISHANPEASAVLDLVYAATGALLIALMWLYADACRRL
jgi:hypothetical protein